MTRKNKPANRWTEAEIEILRQHYAAGGSVLVRQELVKHGFKKEAVAINGKAKRLGLKAPGNGRFQPGQAAANKGKPMSAEMRAKVARTWFKKGEPNHNLIHYDFAVSLWTNPQKNESYWYVKTGFKKFRPLHTWIWLQHHPDFKDGDVVRITDRQAFDALVLEMGFVPNPPKKTEPPGNWQRLIELSRRALPLLELIDRGEHMRRNSASLRLTDGYVANCITWRDKELSKQILKQPQLLGLKRQQLLLNRKIKSVTNE